MPSPADYQEIEQLIHRDPGSRGLASYQHRGTFLDAGQLEGAVRSLIAAQSVGIVTGFCVVDAQPPAAETDGPPAPCIWLEPCRNLASMPRW